MATVKIDGSTDDILSVGLRDVLNCIDNGQDYQWAILWITAVGDLEGITMLDFEKTVNKSENGLVFTWNQLIDLAPKFSQIIEVVIIADADKANLKRYSADEEMYNKCSYVLELVDSSYWIINTKNENTLNKIKSDIAGVTDMS